MESLEIFDRCSMTDFEKILADTSQVQDRISEECLKQVANAYPVAQTALRTIDEEDDCVRQAIRNYMTGLLAQERGLDGQVTDLRDQTTDLPNEITNPREQASACPSMASISLALLHAVIVIMAIFTFCKYGEVQPT